MYGCLKHQTTPFSFKIKIFIAFIVIPPFTHSNTLFEHLVFTTTHHVCDVQCVNTKHSAESLADPVVKSICVFLKETISKLRTIIRIYIEHITESTWTTASLIFFKWFWLIFFLCVNAVCDTSELTIHDSVTH